MSYQLSLAEPVPDELRRIAREQLGRAAERLRRPDGDRVEAVHDARKAVKKTRALLRLVRPSLPREEYQRENAALRDAGALLSGTRDRDVLVATFDDLAGRYVGQIAAEEFDAAREQLTAGPPPPHPAPAQEAAAAALDAIAARIDRWPLEDADAATLQRGLAQVYRRGTKAYMSALTDPSVEALHEWRKRVKDLWYHARLVHDVWPPVLEAQAAELKRLSELLGDDHDLAVLRDALPEDSPVLPLVSMRRDELQAQARRLGALVYAERPKAQRRRMRAWWAAAA